MVTAGKKRRGVSWVGFENRTSLPSMEIIHYSVVFKEVNKDTSVYIEIWAGIVCAMIRLYNGFVYTLHSLLLCKKIGDAAEIDFFYAMPVSPKIFLTRFVFLLGNLLPHKKVIDVFLLLN